uniref:Uncharacterized protein n=1 Tax=Ditylenchus dipsaci TaxID=166011 RepID=A0A915EU28_9BILA
MLKDCQDAYASGDDLDYSILDGHCESETSNSEEELSNAFQPPEIERDVAEPEVQGDVAVQIEGLPSGLVVGSDVMVPWPLSGKKKICAVVVEMSAEEITVQFGTGKRFPYLRYLWNKINVFLPE